MPNLPVETAPVPAPLRPPNWSAVEESELWQTAGQDTRLKVLNNWTRAAAGYAHASGDDWGKVEKKLNDFGQAQAGRIIGDPVAAEDYLDGVNFKSVARRGLPEDMRRGLVEQDQNAAQVRADENRPAGGKVQDWFLDAFSTLGRGALSKGLYSAAEGASRGLANNLPDAVAGPFQTAAEDYAETRKQIASYNGRFGASAYITELVEQELKKSEPKVQ